MTRSSISIFVLAVGLLWAAVVSWFFVAVGGASSANPAYVSKALLWFSWLFIGPLLLITGGILTLMGTHQRAGVILLLIGCSILTVTVGYQVLSTLHDLGDPLIAKPPYGLYAIAVLLTLLSDLGAARVYRLVSLSSPK